MGTARNSPGPKTCRIASWRKTTKGTLLPGLETMQKTLIGSATRVREVTEAASLVSLVSANSKDHCSCLKRGHAARG